ncbi:hypothetical protein Tco_1447497, partial [Tanacetum coccineum]
SGEYHQGTEYSLKDKNKATNDKTKHEMEEREKDKVKSKPKSKKVKVNRSQSQPRDTALERASKTEPELMGRGRCLQKTYILSGVAIALSPNLPCTPVKPKKTVYLPIFPPSLTPPLFSIPATPRKIHCTPKHPQPHPSKPPWHSFSLLIGQYDDKSSRVRLVLGHQGNWMA